MMVTKLNSVDAVVVGVGWCGTILAKELTQAGLKVVGLERGGYRDTDPDFQLPSMHDELRYARRFELFQDLSQNTVTFRNNTNEIARPVREHNPFPWGEGLGGAGVHWAGWTWRLTPWDFSVRSSTIERYGSRAIPEDCTVQDWPITYDELEPFCDKFEYTAGISGKAGNIQGKIQPGGNPFEGPRAREFPNPPLKTSYAGSLFEKATQELGYHPFPMPAGNMSEAYTNPDGVTLGQCIYCGYCSSYGCEVSAKSSPQTTVLPVALATGNFTLRTHAAVTRINLDSTGKRAVSVSYIDANGREFEQPADLILLTAFTFSNVQLLLVSGIGVPYDPASGRGVVGKNYSWHGGMGAGLYYDDKVFNNFIGAGALDTAIADFQGDNFDHTDLGFIGGAVMVAFQGGSGPLMSQPVPPGTPNWGAAWKRAVAHYYNRSCGIAVQPDHISYRGNYLDLDPNYKDVFGMPLLRVTFDFQINEHRASDYLVAKLDEIIKAMGPSSYGIGGLPAHFDAGAPYGVVHQVGGAITGNSPENSVVNKYLQSWDVSNLFVVGASSFPQISSFNPTGTVGPLAFFVADAIKSRYLRQPGPLL